MRLPYPARVALLCPGDGAARNVADDAAPRTALTGCTPRSAGSASRFNGNQNSLGPLYGAHLYNFVAHELNHSTCRRSVDARTDSGMPGPNYLIVSLNYILTFAKDRSIS